MRFKLTAVVVFTALFSLEAASASTSSFNMTGNMTLTSNTITWNSDQAGDAANMFTLTGGTGSFAGITDGSQESIQNLNFATDTPGTKFGPSSFISFPTNLTLADLNINLIFAGVYSAATCGGTPAVGQTCTPAGTPYNFTNNPPGPEATLTMAFQGVTSDGTADWFLALTSQFSVPFQTAVSDLERGSVTNTYSATVTVTPVSTSPVPEPSSLLLLGTGALGFFGPIRRKLLPRK